MTGKRLTAAALVLVAAAAAYAQLRAQVGGGPARLRPPPKPKPAGPAELFRAFNQADTVCKAKVARVVPGPAALSQPPIYSMQITFADVEGLRGAAPKEATFHYQTRLKDDPTTKVGAAVLVAAEEHPPGSGSLMVKQLAPATPANVKLAGRAARLPAGWSLLDDKPVSPFAALGKAGAWPADAKLKGDAVCSRTGRPALRCGEGIRLSVSQIPARRRVTYMNPYGDGWFKLTVTNTTEKAAEVPALLTDEDGMVLWSDSVVVLWQGKSLLLPNAGGLKQVRPLKLAPHQSVSRKIYALKLKGVQWPRGGARVYLRFCLGERSARSFFYFHSRHHGPLLRKVQPEADR